MTFESFSERAEEEACPACVCDGRLDALGPEALADAELMALLIGGRGAEATARHLLNECGGLQRLARWGERDYRSRVGIGYTKARRLVSALELGRRVESRVAQPSAVLNRAEVVRDYMASVVRGLAVEKFWVIALNRRNRALRRVEISSGTATATLAHPREVFRAAIVESAAAIVCVHNHPSGDPAPSAADVQLTRQLREASSAVDIPLLDHVIVGVKNQDPAERGYYSFREAGLL